MASFDNRVYDLVKKIPAGKVSTYKLIAEKLGTKAYRAVGQALRRNTFRDVPCHRVINSSGFVGNFNKGISLKIKLLKLENVELDKNNRIELKRYLFEFK